MMGEGLSQDNAMGATVNGQDHDGLEDGEVDNQEEQPALHTMESHEHTASVPRAIWMRAALTLLAGNFTSTVS